MALEFSSEQPVPGLELFTYDNLDTADTSPPVIQAGSYASLAGSVQVVGTFGGATVTLQGSNDNTNWVTLKDVFGSDVSLTSTGAHEFSTSMRYIRPLVSSGSGDDLDVYITVRI